MSIAANTAIRLPIFATVASAYAAIFSQPLRLIMAALLPLTLMLTIWLAALPWETLPTWYSGLAPFIDALPFVFFGLIWFRLLLAEPYVGLLPRPLFGPRSLAYFSIAIFVYLVFLLPCIIIIVPVVAGFLDALEAGAPELPGYQLLLCVLVPGILLLWFYLLARFSLLLPAAAVDLALAVGAAWRSTARNGLRLLACYVLASLPVLFILVGLVGFALYRGHWGPVVWENEGIPSHVSLPERAATDVAVAAMRLIWVALLASIAASAFRQLTEYKLLHQELADRFD